MLDLSTELKTQLENCQTSVKLQSICWNIMEENNFMSKITLCNLLTVLAAMFLDAESIAFNFCKASRNLSRCWNWLMVNMEYRRGNLRRLEVGGPVVWSLPESVSWPCRHQQWAWNADLSCLRVMTMIIIIEMNSWDYDEDHI